MNREPIDRNCLSYWFPILQEAGMPVPETHIVLAEDCPLMDIVYGHRPKGFGDFINRLRDAGKKVGYPLFLRTGQTSAKHYWKDTCFVKTEADLPSHVAAIVDFSANCDFMGLPVDVWAVRRYWPMESTFTAFKGDLPINRERRFFIRDGKIQCSHAYWPKWAVAEGNPSNPNWEHLLGEGPVSHVFPGLNQIDYDDRKMLEKLTEYVATKFPGEYWSVDWAKTQAGIWLLIDMAEGDRSFHDISCVHCPEEMRKKYSRRQKPLPQVKPGESGVIDLSKDDWFGEEKISPERIEAEERLGDS